MDNSSAYNSFLILCLRDLNETLTEFETKTRMSGAAGCKNRGTLYVEREKQGLWEKIGDEKT